MSGIQPSIYINISHHYPAELSMHTMLMQVILLCNMLPETQTSGVQALLTSISSKNSIFYILSSYLSRMTWVGQVGHMGRKD